MLVETGSQVGLKSDYNDLYASGQGRVGSWRGTSLATLGAWRSASFADPNSLFVDPLFVDPAGADDLLGYVSAASDGRDDDFHLQSLSASFHGGMLAPVLDYSTGWPQMLAPVAVIDAAQSPAIDRGDAASPFGNEPLPNGGYINLGAYGNTDQASKSPTQYVLVTNPDGGETWPAGQTFAVRWRSAGAGTDGALHFDGVDDYVTMGDPADNSLDLAAQATIEAWVRFDALPTNTFATVASKDQGPGPTNKWIFAYANNYAGVANATILHINGSAGSVFLASSPWTPTVGQWYHLAVVRDGNNYTFYRDGQLDGTASTTIGVPDVPSAFELGRAEGNFCWRGDLDEVRLWNRARSPAEIQATFGSTLTGAEANLVGYWPLDGGAVDLSPQQHNGVLGGGNPAQQPTVTSGPLVAPVSIELIKGGSVVQSLSANAQAGQFSWTILSATPPGADYRIRVTRGALVDESNGDFTIAAPVNVYYVNDATVEPGDWTTAPGNDANNGLTPATPKASIRAILEAYDLAQGDLIRVDAGEFHLSTNIIISAADSGVTIEAYHDPDFPLRKATIDRGDAGGSAYAFELASADDVTLEQLTITGGGQGIFAGGGSDSDRLTVRSCTIYGNDNRGILLFGSNDFATLVDNVLYGSPAAPYWANQEYGIYLEGSDGLVSGNTVYDCAYTGIEVYGARSTVSGNVLTNNGTGINAGFGGSLADRLVVTGNTVHGGGTGISAGANVNFTGSVLVGQNEVYALTTGLSVGPGVETTANLVHDNTNGIISTHSGLVSGNRVWHNANIGIGMDGATVRGNRVYSNSIGIYTTIAYAFGGQILNNLVYGNTNEGILVRAGQPSAVVANNTVYQRVGDAIRVQDNTNGTRFRNNVLWVDAGYDLYVAPDSQVGFGSDYNVVHTGTGLNARVGYWNGANRDTLAAWQAATGQDAHSSAANPLFVDIDGADNILAYDALAVRDGGQDDNFSVLASSPAIDGADNSVAPPVDIDGRPRVDDPGTPNHGSPAGTFGDIGAYEFQGSSLDVVPPTIVASVPAAIHLAGIVDEAIVQIQLALSEAVNPTDALAVANFDLRAAGPDGLFGTLDDRPIALGIDYVPGATALTLLVGGAGLADGQYRLTVVSNSTSSIHDLAGVPLDGDGDAVPGGDYVRSFRVQRELKVTNTNDNGPGSLRQAMLDANASPGTPDTIVFQIAGAGPHPIQLAAPLPLLIDSVTFAIAGDVVEIGTWSAFGLDGFSRLTKSGEGTLVLGGAGSLSGQALTVAEGKVQLANGGPLVLVLDDLAIAPAATLDLTDNDLIVRASFSSRDDVLARITALVASGANQLTWSGPGITSSAAATDPALLTTLGTMLNDNGLGGPFYPSFDGVTVDRNAVIVKYTYYGDADLSGTIDGTDYALIDNGFNAQLTGHFNGDFDYSGAVDGTDYALIDNAFNSQGGPLADFGFGPIPRATSPVEAAATANPAQPAPAPRSEVVGQVASDWFDLDDELLGAVALGSQRGRRR